MPSWLTNKETSFTDFVKGVVALGYNTIITIGVLIFVVRATAALFMMYKIKSNPLIKSQITADQGADKGRQDFIVAITGMLLLMVGSFIVRIIIQLVFPEFMWIFTW